MEEKKNRPAFRGRDAAMLGGTELERSLQFVFSGLKGIQGDKGEQGIQGEIGPQGPQGPQGEKRRSRYRFTE